jgi:two-component system, sensor histidine kinase
MRFLIVDDDATSRSLIEALLKSDGITVEQVNDAVAAVTAVRHKQYDLVLMDVKMPEFSGIKAAQWIRAIPGAHGQVPIIAVTGNSAEEYRERCLAAGMDGFLTKPFRKQDLLQAVQDAAAKRRASS